MSEGEEVTHEVAGLKKAIAEKGEKLDSVEKEVDALKKEKAESEKKVRELERKVGLLEVKEIEEKSKKLRVEEEMREKIDEKDREIIVFKRRVDELVSELDNWKFEKKSVEENLTLSENKSKEMEFLIIKMKILYLWWLWTSLKITLYLLAFIFGDDEIAESIILVDLWNYLCLFMGLCFGI